MRVFFILLGFWLFLLQGCSDSSSKGFDLAEYEELCNEGNATICEKLGFRYYAGNGVSKDINLSNAFYQKQNQIWQKECDEGYSGSCEDLVDRYEKGIPGVLAVNLNKAQELYQKENKILQKECDEGSSGSCRDLADRYKEGKEGVSKDLNKAKEFYQKQNQILQKFYQKENKILQKECDEGSSGNCEILAARYKEGIPSVLAVNLNEAKEYYQKACDLDPEVCKNLNDDARCDFFDDGAACYDVAQAYAKGKYLYDKNPKKAQQYYIKACELDYYTACFYAAYNNKNTAQAAKYYEKACSQNIGVSCNNLGVIYANGGKGVKQDFKQAAELYKRACNLGSEYGCENYAYLLRDGRGVRQDFVAARMNFETACSRGKASSCNELGLMYRFGKGVKQNFGKAKEFFGKACDKGEQKGCNYYRILNEQGVR